MGIQCQKCGLILEADQMECPKCWSEEMGGRPCEITTEKARKRNLTKIACAYYRKKRNRGHAV